MTKFAKILALTVTLILGAGQALNSASATTLSVESQSAISKTAKTEKSRIAGFPLELTRVLHNEVEARKLKSQPYRLFLRPFVTGKTIEMDIGLNFTRAGVSGAGGTAAFDKNGQMAALTNCVAATGGSSTCKELRIYPQGDINETVPSSEFTTVDLSGFGGVDNHEITFDPDGEHFWASQYVVHPCSENEYLCGSKKPALTDSYFDCRVIKFDTLANVSYSWTASRKLPKTELRMEHWSDFPVGGAYDGAYADPFHCNSLDISPDGKKFLVSMRHTDAVYEINIKTGVVNWKLGGNYLPGKSLLIRGKNRSTLFGGQHDARYAKSGTVSIFDNGTSLRRAARGLVMKADVAKKTASFVSVMNDPLREHSRCTGSLRPVLGSPYWVAAWGCSSNGATVFDSAGRPIVSAYFARSAVNLPYIGSPFPFLATSFGYRGLLYLNPLRTS